MNIIRKQMKQILEQAIAEEQAIWAKYHEDNTKWSKWDGQDAPKRPFNYLVTVRSSDLTLMVECADYKLYEDNKFLVVFSEHYPPMVFVVSDLTLFSRSDDILP